MQDLASRKILAEKLREVYGMGYQDGLGMAAGLSGGKKRKRAPAKKGKAAAKKGGARKKAAPRKRKPAAKKGGARKKAVAPKAKKAGVLIDNYGYGGILVDGMCGEGISGGKKRGRGNGTKKQKAAARNNHWIQRLKEYMERHGGTYKEAMIALGSK